MLTCARCDKPHLPQGVPCSGAQGGPCICCSAPVLVRDAKGLLVRDREGGRVICLNGHDWGAIGREESLTRWYGDQVEGWGRENCPKGKGGIRSGQN